MNRRDFLKVSGAAGVAAVAQTPPARIDLRRATVVVREGNLPNPERTAAAVLVDEVSKRCGIKLPVSTRRPTPGPVIAITGTAAGIAPEGFRLVAEGSTVSVSGADARGALFGVGRLLRELDWTASGDLWLDGPRDIATAPAYPIRGHQLGYRAQANSYDAWTPAQFEQYIRELTFFGANSIEAIPFEDDRPTPVMKFGRREMNKAMGEICHRYGLDYWHWLPAVFDLKNTERRNKLLAQCDELFHDCPTISGIFFPGGDPGSNPPDLVLPFLEDVSRRLLPVHPNARIWLSLQWFNAKQAGDIYAWLERESPKWFGGLVTGPSSPPADVTRPRLPKQYKLRLYPDLTHNKLSQYEVPQWDQAYALTLGREAINPRPYEFAAIHNREAPFSDGFISYSDGVHDDVNKTIWSALSWDPQADVYDIVRDYARVYFHPSVASEAADAILALERNWHGALIENGAVEGTLSQWRELERKAPQLAGNWRWQMCLLRANYDAHVRRRLIRESKLENQANAILGRPGADPDEAITAAMRVLNEAVERPTSPELRARIVSLCEDLFQSIGLQTSVPKYHASGAERGAVLDFIDRPLNNRWWLEDEFKKIRAMPSREDKRRRLVEIATWENPGPGSFYDNSGNLSKSPHVVRADVKPSDPSSIAEPGVTFWWWEQGKSRARLTWQVTMWPVAVVYDALDANGTYVVQTSGYGKSLLRINGERVTPTKDPREIGERKEFPVDPKFLKGGRLKLTWDRPTDEEHLNWRQQSRLSEVWLIRRG